jgi:hypothetical protein
MKTTFEKPYGVVVGSISEVVEDRMARAMYHGDEMYRLQHQIDSLESIVKFFATNLPAEQQIALARHLGYSPQ